MVVQSSCPTCQVVHFNANGNVMVDSAMQSHNFSSSTVSSLFDCFIKCRQNCLCQSFNYMGTYWSAGICQLNNADSYEDLSSIVVKNGWLFYNLDRQVGTSTQVTS